MYEETFITVRYDFLRTSKIELHRQTDGIDVYRNMLDAGCVPYLKQPELRDRFGLEPLNLWSSEETAAFERESKAALLDAYASGDHVFWLLFGKHSGYTVRIFDVCRKPPRFSDAWIAGFFVVRREAWNWSRNRLWPQLSCIPCSKYVVARYLAECAETIEAHLNGSLVTWRYVSWKKEHWGLVFTSEEAALADALAMHPKCSYEEGGPFPRNRREVLRAKCLAYLERRRRIAVRRGKARLDRLKASLNRSVSPVV